MTEQQRYPFDTNYEVEVLDWHGQEVIRNRVKDLIADITARVRGEIDLPGSNKVDIPFQARRGLWVAVEELIARQDAPTERALGTFVDRIVGYATARTELAGQIENASQNPALAALAHVVMDLDAVARVSKAGNYLSGAAIDKSAFEALLEREYQACGQRFLPLSLTPEDARKWWQDQNLPGEPVCVTDLQGHINLGRFREQIKFVTDRQRPENANAWVAASNDGVRLCLMEERKRELALRGSTVDPARRARHKHRHRR